MAAKEYFCKLEEYLYDVQRVVTPRWLSRELGLKAHHAKKLIEDFYESERPKARRKTLRAVYIVSGKLKSGDDVLEVSLVPEAKLEDAKARFSECNAELYSLYPSDLTSSPASGIINANCEHALDSREDFGKYERIRSKVCLENRSPEEMDRLRRGAYKSGESLGFSKPLPAPPPAPPAQKSKSIVAAFSNAAKKAPAAPERVKSAPSSTTEPEPVAPPKKTSPVKQKGNSLAAMFNRQAEKNKNAPPKPKPEPVEVKQVPVAVSQSQKRKPEVEKESEAKKPNAPPAKKAKTQKPKKQKPKLKRVMALLSDSEDESDEESADRRLRGELEPEPEEVVVKPDLESSDEEDVVPGTPKTQESSQKSGKHKVKRWVDKTFLDAEGFMVTEKVMEVVEEEDPQPETKLPEPEPQPQPPKKEVAEVKPDLDKENQKKSEKTEESAPKGKGRPKKAPSASSGKQSSIMSFFSKAK